jgi:hypothetical protein
MQHEGVVADPNMEYGEEYGDYEGYEEGGMDGSYEGSMMDNSGLGGNDGNKGKLSILNMGGRSMFQRILLVNKSTSTTHPVTQQSL